jgi:co-chaperonin GroES (HSP10)
LFDSSWAMRPSITTYKKQSRGIIIPDSAKEKPMESMVVAVGTGKVDENGDRMPFEVKKGGGVLVSRYGDMPAE